MSSTPALTARETDPVQQRTVATLVGSQMFGGIGVSSGIAVGALLAEEILGSPDLAGLANTAQVLGAALLSVPAARLMAARGRRLGLVAAYLVGLLGAGLVVAAVKLASFPLLLVATALFGAANTANNQARYAATDLAAPAHRGRALAMVVWATTVGAVLGPNLVGPAGRLAEAFGLEAMLGPFLLSLAGFACAALWLTVRLRPDPLLLARARAADAGEEKVAHGSLVRALRVIAGSRVALLGLAGIAIGHTIMVSVMVMTPLHMHHGGAELRLIGLVISVHVAGMYAFSPLMGVLVDRLGGRAVILLGAGLLLAAAIVSGHAPEGWSGGLTVGLFLLGLGWSATLVAGSTLLTAAVPIGERPGVQGAADLVMGLAAAGGGALSGVVVGTSGYAALCTGAGIVAVVLAVLAALMRGRAAAGAGI